MTDSVLGTSETNENAVAAVKVWMVMYRYRPADTNDMEFLLGNLEGQIWDRVLGLSGDRSIFPCGVSVVPREPTEAMLIAARDWSYAKYGKPIGDEAAIGCWRAMMGAAKNAG
jgi:hypothetical protein